MFSEYFGASIGIYRCRYQILACQNIIGNKLHVQFIFEESTRNIDIPYRLETVHCLIAVSGCYICIKSCREAYIKRECI